MIQANELRIGNLVLQDGKMKSVNYIDAAFVYKFVAFKGEEFNADNLYADRECDPIPLTEEILLKCGIEVKDGYCEIDRIEFEWDSENGLMLDNISILINPYKRLHQLHQLQNLYFALTGQELTVNI